GRGHIASALPDAEIESLRTGLQLRKFEPHPYLVAGERVRIKAGAKEGMEGILLRKKNGLRVVLTLDLIERSVAVEVDAQDVEPVSRHRAGAHSELPRDPRDNWSPVNANAQPESTRHPDGTSPVDMSSTTEATRSGDTSPKTDLIRAAPEINWDYAVIQRLNPQDLTPHLVPFNLGKLV